MGGGSTIELFVQRMFLAADGVPKEGLRIEDVLVRIAVLNLIQDKVSSVCLMKEFYLTSYFMLLRIW